MKFLVPNYSCLQNPWLGGYRPQIPILSVLCPQLNLLNPPPRTKFLGTPLTALITARPLSVSWDRLLQLTTCFWSILITSHLCLALLSSLFPSGFLTRICVWVPHASPVWCSVTDRPNNIWWGVQIIKLVIIQFSPVLLFSFLPLRPKLTFPPTSHCYKVPQNSPVVTAAQWCRAPSPMYL
jgi:hypothetical protein